MKKNANTMSNAEFKTKAKTHQTNFRNDPEIGVPAMPEKCKVEEANYPIINNPRRAELIRVLSSLLWEDAKDDLGFRIFYSGFRKEITQQVYADRKTRDFKITPMVTNLLRSEHIPYNVFFPMTWDKIGATDLFNDLLHTDKIKTIQRIDIEYNPGTLYDGTAFDVYVEYQTVDGKIGGIGIEVKYTEKEYALKKYDREGNLTKEYRETHDQNGIHLADNYKRPSEESMWFKADAICDIPFAEINRNTQHVVMNHYRQIWRNHILGASMMLPNENNIHLDEFISLTVYPKDNGHFSSRLWDNYEGMLTDVGKATFRHITYEELFPKMRTYLRGIKDVDNWIDYLNRRYLITN